MFYASINNRDKGGDAVLDAEVGGRCPGLMLSTTHSEALWVQCSSSLRFKRQSSAYELPARPPLGPPSG